MSLSKMPLQSSIFTRLQAEATMLGIQVLRRRRVLRKGGSSSTRKDQDLERFLEARPLLLHGNALQVLLALFPYDLVVCRGIHAGNASFTTVHIFVCVLCTCLTAYNTITPPCTPTDVAQESLVPCPRDASIASVNRTSTILAATNSPRTRNVIRPQITILALAKFQMRST